MKLSTLRERWKIRHTVLLGWMLAAVLVAIPDGLPGMQSFQINPSLLPDAVGDVPYNFQLTTSGGAPPLRWSLAAGQLPAGLRLDPASGALSGRPPAPAPRGAAATSAFTVLVTDANGDQVSRRFELMSGGALTLSWTQPPALDGSTLSAAAQVSNRGQRAVDVTFIAVALNQQNKAFTLGYQRVTVEARQQINVPFRSQLPQGRYRVHVDAVGGAGAQVTYRALLDTAEDFIVP